MSRNQQEMKKALKDANMYEENMSEEMVTTYYNAIKESADIFNRSTTDEVSTPDLSNNSMNGQSFNKSELSTVELQSKSMNDSVNELLTAMNDSENISPSVKERLREESGKTFTPKKWHSDRKRNLLATNHVEKEPSNDNFNISETEIENEEKEQPTQSRVVRDDDDLFTKLKNNTNKITNNLKNVNQIGFNDMPVDLPRSVYMEKNMLKFHELKRINIQNSKKYLVSDSETRIMMLYEYHVASEKLRGQRARQSRLIAPLPKLISLGSGDSSYSLSSGGSQDQKSPIDQSVGALREDEHREGFTEYVSRSGRHTRRKVYCEEDSQENTSSSPKKARATNNNDDWISKGSPRVAKLPKKGDLVSSTTNNNNDKDFILEGVDEFNKSKRPFGRPKSGANKNPSNKEIMLRCSTLFGDSPTRKRSGALVTAGIEEENRRKKEEEKMESFSNSLHPIIEEDAEDAIFVDDERIEVEEIPFAPKRVAPPIPYVGGRKPVNNRKRKQQEGVEALEISTAKRPASSTSSSEDMFESQPVNGNGNNGNSTKRTNRHNSSANIERSEASSSTSKGGRGGRPPSNMVNCPLCSMAFPQKEIVEHAATCGEELVTQSTPKHRRISCPFCDMIIVESAKYDEHVDNCAKQRNSK